MEYSITDRLCCNYNGRDFSGPAPTGMVLPSAIMLEAATEIERLNRLVSSVMAERHEMHDRLMARVEAAEAERDRLLAAKGVRP